MLEVKDLKLSYENAQVLNGVDVSVRRGDVVSIIGPSGTGKTTLLKCINYLVKPTSGTIRFDEIWMDYRRVGKTAVQAIRLPTAMVFQQFNVFKNMTVIQNVLDPLVLCSASPRMRRMKSRCKSLNEWASLRKATATRPSSRVASSSGLA